MISIEELVAIRDKMKDQVAIRHANGSVRVVVGMGTVGIEAGARAVLNALVEGVAAAGLATRVTVTQTAAIGEAENAPVVEVYEDGKEKVTYAKMTVDRANEVIEKHIKGGQVVSAYTIGAAN